MGIWALGIAVAAAAMLAVAVIRAVLVVVTVIGPSMSPALRHGDRVLLARRWVTPIRHGDIVAVRPGVVAFSSPGPDARPPGPWLAAQAPPLPGPRAGQESVTWDDNSARHVTSACQQPWIIKRVTAMGGEPVPRFDPPSGPPRVSPGTRVPPGWVFLTGDNTAVSTDSRVFGPVPQGDIVGRVIATMTQ